MNASLRMVILLLLVVVVTGIVVENAAATPVIYKLDMRYVWSWPQDQCYDYLQTVSCMQGLVNRDAPRLFVVWFDTDLTWLDRLTATGGLCQGWMVQTVNFAQMMSTFRSYVSYLIAYNPNIQNCVCSESLVATTAAAAENAIAIRKNTTPGSMYDYLKNTLGIPELMDLTGKFTGSGTIWQLGIPSTGSAKCDAYTWATYKYIDTGKSDPSYLSYTLDEWSLKIGMGASAHTQLTNLDYAVSKKAFCFELSPWGNELPNDDPTQPLGTDLQTYKMILESCNIMAGYSKMIKFCGFPNFLQKYSTYVGGSYDATLNEWEHVKILTAYNAYMEADASSPGYMSNASFYTALMPEFNDRRYVQNPPKTYSNMVSAGLINSNGTIPAGNYVMIGMGDWDSPCWVVNDLGVHQYVDPVRGQVICNWGVNANMTDRACVAVDYMYRNKSSNDFFIGWDSGAGYVNPSQLYGTRAPSYYSSAVSMWQKHCKDYHRVLDYSITGWLLNGAFTTTLTDIDNFAPFSGDGIGVWPLFNFSCPAYRSWVPVSETTSGVIDYSTGAHFQFSRGAATCAYPNQTKAMVDSYAGSGHNHRFLSAYDYNYLLRYYLGNGQIGNYCRATWVSDTIPRIMAHGVTYPVTVTVRNDGWDTWTEASYYRLGHAIVAPGAIPTYTNYDSNGRHYLPVGSSIAPGQSVTFSFNITAPATNGSYDLYYDMVQDGNAWFRDRENIEWKKVIIVATNQADVDTDGDRVSDVSEIAQGTLYWHPDDY